MICLVALDLVLRIVGRRVMNVAFVIDVSRMNSHDPPSNAPGFRVPTHVIADFEPIRHRDLSEKLGGLAMVPNVLVSALPRVRFSYGIGGPQTSFYPNRQLPETEISWMVREAKIPDMARAGYMRL